MYLHLVYTIVAVNLCPRDRIPLLSHSVGTLTPAESQRRNVARTPRGRESAWGTCHLRVAVQRARTEIYTISVIIVQYLVQCPGSPSSHLALTLN